MKFLIMQFFILQIFFRLRSNWFRQQPLVKANITFIKYTPNYNPKPLLSKCLIKINFQSFYRHPYFWNVLYGIRSAARIFLYFESPPWCGYDTLLRSATIRNSNRISWRKCFKSCRFCVRLFKYAIIEWHSLVINSQMYPI